MPPICHQQDLPPAFGRMTSVFLGTLRASSSLPLKNPPTFCQSHLKAPLRAPTIVRSPTMMPMTTERVFISIGLLFYPVHPSLSSGNVRLRGAAICRGVLLLPLVRRQPRSLAAGQPFTALGCIADRRQRSGDPCRPS